MPYLYTQITADEMTATCFRVLYAQDHASTLDGSLEVTTRLCQVVGDDVFMVVRVGRTQGDIAPLFFRRFVGNPEQVSMQSIMACTQQVQVEAADVETQHEPTIRTHFHVEVQPD